MTITPPTAETERPSPAARPVPPRADLPPVATRPVTPPNGAANGIRHLALKEQATGTDARAERFFRQVRAEVDELRKSIGQRRNVDHEFAELDVEAVAANPEAASHIPPEVLVKALVETHRANQRMQRKLVRSRARNARLEDRIRAIKQTRAFERGRLETLDRVIGALHENLEDLRLARDAEMPRIESPAEPRVLRPGTLSGPDALPPAENA